MTFRIRLSQSHGCSRLRIVFSLFLVILGIFFDIFLCFEYWTRFVVFLWKFLAFLLPVKSDKQSGCRICIMGNSSRPHLPRSAFLCLFTPEDRLYVNRIIKRSLTCPLKLFGLSIFVRLFSAQKGMMILQVTFALILPLFVIGLKGTLNSTARLHLVWGP